MSRLPVPGQDKGVWGSILNDFLNQSHNDDGSIKPSALPQASSSSQGVMSASDKAKLDTIAERATTNATDAQLRDRSTHTGTQSASTISDFTATAAAAAPVQSVDGDTGAVSLQGSYLQIPTVAPADTSKILGISSISPLTTQWKDAPQSGQWLIPTGVVGDGVADDTGAIQAALDIIAAAGGGTVYLPRGTYLLKNPLFLGSKTTLRGSGKSATIITKPASVKSLLTANASPGATSVTVADATGFEIGKAIHIADSSSFEWFSTQGKITSITGNVISLTNAEGLGRTGLDGAVQTSRSGFASTSFPLLRNIEGSVDIVVQDLTLDQNKNVNDPVNEFTIGAVHWVETYHSVVENCALVNAPSDAYSDQAQDGTGITPAANLIKTTKNIIRNCYISNAGRHGIHLGTCMNGGFVLNNDISSCAGYAYFYCAYVTYTVASGNLVEGCGSGFAGIDARDYGNVITNNIIKNCTTGYAIDAANGGTNGGKLVIVGNSIIAETGFRARCYINVCDSIFSDNIVDMGPTLSEAIRFGTESNRCRISGNVIIQSSGAGGSTGAQIEGDDIRFTGNLISGFSVGAKVRGVDRLIATSNTFVNINSSNWQFESAVSTDCVIKDEQNTKVSPVSGEASWTSRLVYEGLGDNGIVDPVSSGAWNGITGRRFDGQMVRWNSGGGEKISIFYNGIGWTSLN